MSVFLTVIWEIFKYTSAASVAFYGLYRFYVRWSGDRDHHFNWSKVESGVSHIVREMNRKNFQPRTVIAIGRGGAVLAALVVDSLLILPRPAIFMIDRRLDDSSGSRKVAVLNDIADFVSPPNEPVLLVAGLTKSGRTIDAYKEWLAAKGVNDVKSATLVEGGATGTKTDFYFKVVGLTDRPAYFPWYKKLGQEPR